MALRYILLGTLLGVILVAAGLYLLAKRLQRREPYASFLRLSTGRKVRFLRLLLTDPRIPPAVKALPLLLALYLASPIDLIPDFIPVLGYLDDVAIVLATLALIVRLTPREVLDELLERAGE